MHRRTWIELSPALLIAAGVLSASLLAAHLSGWLMLAAPLLLSLTVLAADMLENWLRGSAPVPTLAGLFLASAILVATGIVGVGSPQRLADMIPILGAGAVVILVPRRRRQPTAC